MLSQKEAAHLMSLPKRSETNDIYNFPPPKEMLKLPLISHNGKERFFIDINRRGILISRCSYQERYRKTVILARLDIHGPPHRNPKVDKVPFPFLAPYNGKELSSPHLHIYVEGFDDKWAISADCFPHTSDLYQTLLDFFDFCNVIKPPRVMKGLFT